MHISDFNEPMKRDTVRKLINCYCMPGKQGPAFAGLPLLGGEVDLQSPPHKGDGLRSFILNPVVCSKCPEIVSTPLSASILKTTRDNRFLFKPAPMLTNPHKCEPTEGKQGTQPVHYPRKFLTSAGELDLEVPKLRTSAFDAYSHEVSTIPGYSKNR